MSGSVKDLEKSWKIFPDHGDVFIYESVLHDTMYLKRKQRPGSEVREFSCFCLQMIKAPPPPSVLEGIGSAAP